MDHTGLILASQLGLKNVLEWTFKAAENEDEAWEVIREERKRKQLQQPSDRVSTFGDETQSVTTTVKIQIETAAAADAEDDIIPPRGSRPPLLAPNFNPLEKVNLPLKIKDKMEERGVCSVTALRQAALFNRLECVKFLLKTGGAVIDKSQTPEEDKLCPLMAALACGNESIAKYLIDKLPAQNAANLSSRHYVAPIKYGQPPLCFELMGIKFRQQLVQSHRGFKKFDLSGIYPDFLATCKHSSEKKFDKCLGLESAAAEKNDKKKGKVAEKVIVTVESMSSKDKIMLVQTGKIRDIKDKIDQKIFTKSQYLINAKQCIPGTGVLYVMHQLDSKKQSGEEEGEEQSGKAHQKLLLQRIATFINNHNLLCKRAKAREKENDKLTKMRNHDFKLGDGAVEVKQIATDKKAPATDKAEEEDSGYAILFTSKQRLEIEYIWIDFMCLSTNLSYEEAYKNTLAAAAFSTHCIVVPKCANKKTETYKNMKNEEDGTPALEDFITVSTRTILVSDWKRAFGNSMLTSKIIFCVLTGSQLFCDFECGLLVNGAVEYGGCSLEGHRFSFLNSIGCLGGGGPLYSGFEVCAGRSITMKGSKVQQPTALWDLFLKNFWEVGMTDPSMTLLSSALDFYDSATFSSKKILRRATRFKIVWKDLDILKQEDVIEKCKRFKEVLNVEQNSETVLILQSILFVMAFFRGDIPWEISSNISIEAMKEELGSEDDNPNFIIDTKTKGKSAKKYIIM